ncbi:aquaporin-1 [Petromyzon marinus]|uniref:Aquaporin-1-like n=2 Tax=Petromyzon marinus TaxID=7757 RepID=A0AAJ7X4M0_PETMA|nr:aquaporin-1-like [Petromyzon marinus]
MASELRSRPFWRAVFAEFLATAALVALGIGSTLRWGRADGSVDVVRVSLAFGLAVATLVQCVGHVSGGHLNPAVTFGLLVGCRLSAPRALLYMVAQVSGALAASGLLYGLTPAVQRGSLGLNSLGPGVTHAQGFGVEVLITFALVLCVLASTDSRRRDVGGSLPLAVGFAVALGHLFAINFTGCSMNPARSFAPAVLTRNFKDHWVFWLGPLSGSLCAALFYDFLLAPRSMPLRARLRALRAGPIEEASPAPHDSTESPDDIKL